MVMSSPWMFQQVEVKSGAYPNIYKRNSDRVVIGFEGCVSGNNSNGMLAITSQQTNNCVFEF